MKDMYRFQKWESVEAWFGEEQGATNLTLTALAIGELLDEMSSQLD